jgi:hypothetical protein
MVGVNRDMHLVIGITDQASVSMMVVYASLCLKWTQLFRNMLSNHEVSTCLDKAVLKAFF